MNPFELTKAASVADAVGKMAKKAGARPIAGGTNMLDLMKESVARPPELIDITGLDLRDVTELDDGGLRIGALVSNADVAYDKRVQEHYPLLSQAILAGASAQLRNMASTGGNLLQRTRCYYFYDTATPCNKREPGSGCGALKGRNRIHAILGASDHCVATHPSDMCVALAALAAVVNVEGPRGRRSIPMAEFHRLPDDQPEIDTTLAPNELILSVDLPPEGFAARSTYLKIRDRQSYAFALVSVAVAVEVADGKITDARLALGGVAHKPWRKREAEELLIGRAPAAAPIDAAADELLQGARGLKDNHFKIELARRAIARAWQDALQKGSEHDHRDERRSTQPRRRARKGHGPGEVRI